MSERRDGDNDDDDRVLLRRWRAGDKDAGSQLFRRHFRAMSRFFRNKLASTEDPADLLQETFLALLRSNVRAGADSPTWVRGYLYSIANHVLCAHLRKKYKQQSERLDFSAVCVKDLEPASMSSIIMQRRDLQVFVQALRAIPIEDQILLESKYFDELSVAEIGELMAVPGSTLPGRLQRAKARLRQRVEQLSLEMPEAAELAPSDDDLERWAREVREQMGWQARN